ncbi:MAG: isocitrate/isopropylmalate dehydrogenase family protein [Alphaproteobacteria bacterium]|nr:isocitrate/isopropylmalate dehydrogenase family protein [Alphaproteobacteria bacterium]
MKYRVTLIEGDGIGPEVTGATCRILHAAGAPIEWEQAPGGAAAVAQYGVPMPDDTMASVKRNRLGLKGPLETPKGKGFRSANVTLRQELELYVGYRPVRSLPGIHTPYKDVDLLVLRENTEDLYAGIEHELKPGMVMSLKVSTRQAGERISRWAFEHMRNHGHRKIHCCHKASVVPMADGAFLDAFHAIGAEYPFIEKDDLPVDNLAFALAQDPGPFDVLLLQNLYGDILSDLAAGLVGGLGVAPGANIGDRIAVFEAVHGTAPDIAGQDKANPLSVLLSALLMLEYVGEVKLVERIERAVFDVLEEGRHVTGDLGGSASCSRFTDAIIDKL